MDLMMASASRATAITGARMFIVFLFFMLSVLFVAFEAQGLEAVFVELDLQWATDGAAAVAVVNWAVFLGLRHGLWL